MGPARKILLATVGGSHAPIVRAIADCRPDFVWFICTDGKFGSITQIRGQGNCIKAHPRDEKPTLPNIPTQTGLREDQYGTITVPPDDPGPQTNIESSGTQCRGCKDHWGEHGPQSTKA